MAATSFFGDTLDVVYKIGAVLLTVGILKGVEIRAEWEHIELHGQETVFMEDVARRKVRVSVKAKFAKFHPNVFGKILGTETADTDIDGAAKVGYTRATITDSNVEPLFTLQGTLVGKNLETYIGKVTNVYWENAPFLAPEGEYPTPDLSGYGDKMYLEYKTV
uniref:Tail protein n=1 Tax=viral metagenome TaxID=1070528 RepID=A0A6H2A310_9ZZZZ